MCSQSQRCPAEARQQDVVWSVLIFLFLREEKKRESPLPPHPLFPGDSTSPQGRLLLGSVTPTPKHVEVAFQTACELSMPCCRPASYFPQTVSFLA